jgi:hypothetical protein
MKSMTKALTTALLIAACGESDPMANAPAATGGTGGAAPVSCEQGQQTCHCPDGTMTGLQLCDANQGLLPCSCLTPTAPSDSGTGGMGASPEGGAGAEPATSMRVCEALTGVAECDARSYVSDEIPSSVLFVLDRSGSMTCNPPPVQTVESCNTTPIAQDPSKPSRWSITVDALKEALGGLEDTNVSAGLTFFSVDNACGVNSTPSVGVQGVTGPQLLAMSAALDGISPRGGTPIVGAVVLAYAHLHQEAKAAGNRYVVLLTDGEESCGFAGDESDTMDLVEARRHLLEVEVQKARDANVRTFVIGAPGSEGARGFLSELAFKGGTARATDCVHGNSESQVGDCHYDLTQSADFAQVLKDALGDISGQALGCEFPTPTGTSEKINVQYLTSGSETPVCLAYDDRPCAEADGFQFAKLPDGSDDLSRVVLCGGACEQVKKDPGIAVDVILGCQTVLVE